MILTRYLQLCLCGTLTYFYMKDSTAGECEVDCHSDGEIEVASVTCLMSRNGRPGRPGGTSRAASLTSLYKIHSGLPVDALVDKMTIVTLHRYQVNWNIAQLTCKAYGGNLYRFDSEERSRVLKKYRTYTGWGNEDSFASENVWIGLHSVSTHAGRRWMYGTDPCEEVEENIYSNWDVKEPDWNSTKYCGYQNRKTTKWGAEDCNVVNNFICENDLDTPCTIDIVIGVLGEEIAGQYLENSIATVNDTACQYLCLVSSFYSLSCLAATYDEELTTCTGYYTIDPFLFTGRGGIQDDGSHNFFVKVCYSDAINLTMTRTRPVTSLEPEEGCLSSFSVSHSTNTYSLSTTIQMVTTALASNECPHEKKSFFDNPFNTMLVGTMSGLLLGFFIGFIVRDLVSKRCSTVAPVGHSS